MSILSDSTIIETIASGRLVIRPFAEMRVQPSSLDVTLGGDEPLVLRRGRFQLSSTAEWVELPDDIQAQVHGRSSIGRLGVLVHFTAGLIDPGFRGRITLECIFMGGPTDWWTRVKELFGFGPTITFYPGDRIGQLSFHWLDKPAAHPYAGRYQGQKVVTASRFKHAIDEE